MYNNIIEYLFHKQKRKIEKVGKCWLYVTVIFEVSPSFEVDCLVHLMYKFVEGEISFKSLGSKNSQLISKILTMNQLNKTTKFRHIFKWSHDYFLKNGPIPASFSFIFGLFQTNNTIFYNKSMWKNVMSIQYMALGFEPTTFGTWVSSHNH